MALSLNEPTGAQILSALALGPDEFQPWSAAEMDAHRTSEQAASVQYLALAHVREVLEGAGYDPDALDNLTEWPYAWRALRLICAHEFIKLDRIRTKQRGKDCEPQAMYEERQLALLGEICRNFGELGIREASPYCLNKFDLITISTHNICE